MPTPFGPVVWGALLLACSGESPSPTEASPTEAKKMVAADADAAKGSAPAADARILAAYHGLDRLPARVAQICPLTAVGKDGMPVTFSVRLDPDTLDPEDFVVETASGGFVTPVCATLAPAEEPLEGRTVLLAGTFGTPEAPPRAVAVVGSVNDTRGATLEGLRTMSIVRLEAGPSVVLAERFAPDTAGLAGECPPATEQVVQLTWQGGVTGPRGAALGEAQRQAISVTLEDGSTVVPVALADDDPDNFVHACLDTTTPARTVRVAAGHFHDPGDDANQTTQVEVVEGVP